MECIFAYLLLALYVDLTLELVRMEKDQEKAVWVKRSLWTNTPFDCGTRAVSILAPLTRQKASRNCNRFRKPVEGKPTVTKGTTRNIFSHIAPHFLNRPYFPEGVARQSEG